jgi:hypothetical protein
MAIDPMLYEKLSGRKGDPYSRMGEALAKSDKRKGELRAEKEHLSNMGSHVGMGRAGLFRRLLHLFLRP